VTSSGKAFAGKRVLVTGGLGFIGSNLALRLANDGAEVTVVDPCVPGCGGNPANLDGASSRIVVLPVDIGSPQLSSEVLRRTEVVFNLAGEVSHSASMRMPERDLTINTIAQLRFLQSLASANPGVRVVYAGTRQVYGAPQYLPVDENHPVHPVDFNGVHKYATTMYHLMLSQSGLLDACVLRLTNVYGPRLSLDAADQGVFSAFLRNLTRGERLQVFGDGKQLRDPVFVDDVVNAFLLAGAAERLPSRSYNIGGPAALELGDIAAQASVAAGVAPPVLWSFPEEMKAIDIGSYQADWRRIETELGWRPCTAFADGFTQTLAFCKARQLAEPLVLG
jgi:UDP-glucose 4-epimerase